MTQPSDPDGTLLADSFIDACMECIQDHKATMTSGPCADCIVKHTTLYREKMGLEDGA